MQNSHELAILEQAITLQKKKLWTSWLNADGLHPLAIGLRIARNVAGGGDRAALKLEIARLELRRTELATNLRQAIWQVIEAYETAQEEHTLTQAKLAAILLRLQLAEAGYRLGDGNTEAMFTLWLAKIDAEAQLYLTGRQLSKAKERLLHLILPTAQMP